MILLDTDVVSALRRPDRADMNLVRWASRTPVSELYLSVVTILELEVGVLQLERRDVAQGSVLRTWLEKQILARFDGRILAFDLQAARRCARFHVPDKRPDRDAMIAATAAAHGMVVATRNVGDFAPTGVELINPWVASS
jgi:predicted nucleic acid-binding protein